MIVRTSIQTSIQTNIQTSRHDNINRNVGKKTHMSLDDHLANHTSTFIVDILWNRGHLILETCYHAAYEYNL